MHLVLSKDNFHFFVDKTDLEKLLEGQSVKQSFSQGHSSFNFSIRPYQEEDIFKLYLTPLSIVLFVDMERLKKLETNKGPAKKKLTKIEDGITVTLDMAEEEKQKSGAKTA